MRWCCWIMAVTSCQSPEAARAAARSLALIWAHRGTQWLAALSSNATPDSGAERTACWQHCCYCCIDNRQLCSCAALGWLYTAVENGMLGLQLDPGGANADIYPGHILQHAAWGQVLRQAGPQGQAGLLQTHARGSVHGWSRPAQDGFARSVEPKNSLGTPCTLLEVCASVTSWIFDRLSE